MLMFLGFAHIMDASQGFSSGILRAIGAQMFGFLMNLLCFYAIGLPIGIYLMLSTELRVLGFWIGFFVAACILFILQLVFITRVDWAETAARASSRYKQNLSTLNNMSSAHLPVIGETISAEEELAKATTTSEIRSGEEVEVHIGFIATNIIAQKVLFVLMLILLFLGLVLIRQLLEVLVEDRFYNETNLSSKFNSTSYNQTISL